MCYVHGLSGKLDQVKRTDQLTRQYKTNPNPNPNPKYVLIRYVTNAGLFFSLDPASRAVHVHCHIHSRVQRQLNQTHRHEYLNKLEGFCWNNEMPVCFLCAHTTTVQKHMRTGQNRK